MASLGNPDARKRLVSRECEISLNRQLEILSLSKGTFYYVPVGQSDEELEIMKAIDLEYLEHPTKGVIQMLEHLRSLGYTIGNCKTRRLMRLMDIHAVYPKPSLSKLGRP